MRLEFILPHTTIDLEIDLLDNPGVRHWADSFLNGYQTQATFHDHLYVRQPDWDTVNSYYEQIKTDLKILEEKGIVYTGPEMVEFYPDKSDQIHNWLNHLHRFFTHNQSICNDQTQNTKVNYKILSTALDDLNTQIHQIELYISRGQPDMPVSAIEEIKLYHNTEAGGSAWVNLEPFHEYHSAEYYDIILTSEILGKTIIQSYLDNDNPADWDTSGHYSSAGGLQVCIGPARQQIYNSESFKNWLARHNVSPTDVYYDFPIGSIKNKPISRFNELLKYFRNTNRPQVNVIYHKQ